MKITIDYLSLFDESFNPTIILDPQSDVRVLSQKLVELYGIPENQQLLRHKRDSFTLKLIPGWPISHFCHGEEVVISLDIIGPASYPDEFHLQLQQSNITQNYASEAASPRKMDISGIQRSGSGDSSISRHSSVFFNKSDTSSEGNSLTKVFSRHSDGLSALRRSANSCLVKSKPLIQAAKDGNLENLREHLRELKERGNSQIGGFIDEADHAGWNPLHWSAFRGQSSIVQDLVREGADVNKKTNDEWTPLQLATYRNHIDVMKILLGKEETEVNKVTAKMSAIHIAVKVGNIESIKLLSQYGADLKLETEKGIKPADLTKDGKIKVLLEELRLKAESQEKSKAEPEKIVKGWMLKKSLRLKILNLRYFVLNFSEGTFTRYKRLEDVPHHPHEITFLTDIRIIRRKKQGLLDRKNLHYIELTCARKSILACNNQKIADEWVSYISQAITYTRSAVRSLYNQDRKSIRGTIPSPKYVEEIELYDYKGHGMSIVKEHEYQSERIQEEKLGINDFSVIEEIGHGGFAKVFKVQRKGTGKYYALKAMRKQELVLKRSLKYAISEVSILKKLDSPFVLNLHCAFQTKQHLCLVLDYCSGGTLLSHLSERGVFTEDEARFYIAELILAIESLHSQDIIYRDLKPDNILIDNDGHIKLADFGLAREGVKNLSVAKSICGSPAYLAPEVVQGFGACKGTDMYGIGIILYEMLVGCAPYFSTDLQEMYTNITSKQLDMPKRLGNTAKNLIQKLINREEPAKRIGTKNKAELKKHPFFKGLDWGKLQRKEFKPPMGFGDQSFDTEVSIMRPKSIELDRDDVLFVDGMAHIANFSFVAKGKCGEIW